MSISYNYVQLVADDDWGLVAILPSGVTTNKLNSHTSSDSISHFNSSPINTSKTFLHRLPVPETNPHEKEDVRDEQNNSFGNRIGVSKRHRDNILVGFSN